MLMIGSSTLFMKAKDRDDEAHRVSSTRVATLKLTATRLREDRMFQPMPLIVRAIAVEGVENSARGIEGFAGPGKSDEPMAN